MKFKRVMIENLPEEQVVEDYPDEAYAYVDSKYRLLRHHDSSVQDTMEEESVDVDMLDLAIALVENTELFDDDTKSNVLSHLQSHKSQLLLSTYNKTEEKEHSSKLNNNIPEKAYEVTDENLLSIIKHRKPNIKKAMARISEIQTAQTSIIYYLMIEDSPEMEDVQNGVLREPDTKSVGQYMVPVEVVYDGNGNLIHVRIFEVVISPDIATDLLEFISLIQN